MNSVRALWRAVTVALACWAAPVRADLLVASAETDAVLRYADTTGALVGPFVTAASGGLDQPRGMTIGPDGHLYVASFMTDAVLRFEGSTGAFLDVFVPARSGGLDGPQAVLFGPDDNLYVSSFFANAVLRYDGTTGAFIDSFVASGSGGLLVAAGLAFAGGQLYVSSTQTNQVLRYDGMTGNFVDAFVAAGSGGLDGPSGLLFAPDGSLLVGSARSNQVLRYDGSTGASLGVFVAALSGGLSIPGQQMTFGPDGAFYLGSVAGDAVLRYDGMTGAFLDTFVPAASGGLDVPTGMLFLDLPPPPTTTTTTLPPQGCVVEPVAPTFRSLNCRLAALIEQTAMEPAFGVLAERLLRALGRAKDGKERAESLCGQGQTRQARAGLRQATRQLARYGRWLRSRTARNRVPGEVLQTLAATAGAIRRDAKTLRGALECPRDAGP